MGEKNIVVELLYDKQTKIRPASGARVWVHRLANPENTLPGHSEMTPEWPPIEASVAGAAGATSVIFLKRLVCQAINAYITPTATTTTVGAGISIGTGTGSGSGTGSIGKATSLIAPEKACMYKFSSNTFSWMELKPGMLAAMKSKSNVTASTTTTGMEAIIGSNNITLQS